jgi:hypothetical protein
LCGAVEAKKKRGFSERIRKEEGGKGEGKTRKGEERGERTGTGDQPVSADGAGNGGDFDAAAFGFGIAAEASAVGVAKGLD